MDRSLQAFSLSFKPVIERSQTVISPTFAVLPWATSEYVPFKSVFLRYCPRLFREEVNLFPQGHFTFTVTVWFKFTYLETSTSFVLLQSGQINVDVPLLVTWTLFIVSADLSSPLSFSSIFARINHRVTASSVFSSAPIMIDPFTAEKGLIRSWLVVYSVNHFEYFNI